MKKIISWTTYIYITALTWIITRHARAEVFNDDLKKSMGTQIEQFRLGAGFSRATLGGIIASVIEIFLGLLGMIFTSLLVYAGYLWMTARGNEERVKKAQSIFKESVWGIAIVVSAYAITYFVINQIATVAGGEVEFDAG